MSKALKERLFKAYAGFADKRIKNLDKGSWFCIDGNTVNNMAMCRIFLDVAGEDKFQLIFDGNLPNDPKVKKLIESRGGKLENVNFQWRATTGAIGIDDVKYIGDLRATIKDVTRRPYDEPSWKHSADEISSALYRFVAVLNAHRGNQPL